MKRGLVILALVIAGTAHAGDRATAERYFRAGAHAYAAQSFAAAAADFEEAYKALPLPEIAFSAAQAYRRQYRVDPRPAYVRRAVELYKVYLAHVKSGGRVGDAADYLGEMERELEKLQAAGALQAGGALQAAPARTRLGISVTIAGEGDTAALREIGDATGELARGLTATIDGQPVTPFALVDVAPSEHLIEVHADGYLPVEKKTVAVAGQASLVEVELRPRPAKLAVRTEDGARVTVDGRAAGTGATAALELPAGKHLIAVTHRGREPFARELALGRGQQLTLDAPLVRTGRRRAVPWLVGAGGVLAAGAIATGALALSHDHRASDLSAQISEGNRPPGDADDYDHEVAARDHLVTATWLLGGAAVAAGATALALYWFDTPEPAAERAIVPTVTATSVGASVFGRF